MPWTNADGLYHTFAGERRSFDGGEYPGAGSDRTIELEIDLAGVSTSAAAPTVLGKPYVILPRNSRIDSVEVISETAAVGGTSVNFGTMRYNATEYDYDGLVAALPIANINVSGEKNVLTAGVTYAGAQVGVTTVYPSNIVVYNAGTFTAGRLILRIKIYVPSKDANPGQV